MAAPSYAPAPAAAAPVAAAAAAPVAVASLRDHPGAVKSPMVGTVYLQAEEGAKKFVTVGDTVAAGATLLLIEAMKTFNPVTAPRAGKVTHILIDNQQPVEFGEPLVVIE
jgi:acetyl-CoA carboxylase biotin carboxyl carrier protein